MAGCIGVTIGSKPVGTELDDEMQLWSLQRSLVYW